MKWQFDAGQKALKTQIGRQHDGKIEVIGRKGCALHGPYLFVPAGLLRARVLLEPGGSGWVQMEITSNNGEIKLASSRIHIDRQRTIQLETEIVTLVDDLEVRLFCRGKVQFSISGLELDLSREHQWVAPEPSRPVGIESGKSYAAKIKEGFFDRFLSGPSVMEVGYKGYDHATVPIVPQAVGVDVGYPGYNGRTFPFADSSLDAIYSSHCYEHIPDYRAVLRDWYRLLKIGGFLIIVVPHQHLFERKRQMPSRWNPDHQRFYTPRSLLGELESAFDENSYRIRHLVENDTGFDYSCAPREAGSGSFEIELVVEKIRRPNWVLDDGAVRPYPPADFQFASGQERISPYETRLDLTEVNHLIWGPYSRLTEGEYEAEFFFDGRVTEPVELVVEVAQNANYLATAYVVVAPDADRHHFTLPFTADRDEDFYEFRVRNCEPHPGSWLSFRGVDLRFAKVTF